MGDMLRMGITISGPAFGSPHYLAKASVSARQDHLRRCGGGL